jgi:hypothetical protein
MTDTSKISTALMCSLGSILCRFYCIFEQWEEKMRGAKDFGDRRAKRKRNERALETHFAVQWG